MKKLLSSFLLLLLFANNCSNNSVKKVPTPYQQGNAVWKMTSADESQAKWTGQSISVSEGSADPSDYRITLQQLGNQRIKLKLVDTEITDKNTANFSAPGKFNVHFNNAHSHDFINPSFLRETFQSKNEKFIFSASFGINCDTNATEPDKIMLTINKGTSLIKSYTFEASGFKRVSEHLVCR
jgi:hypothetical protein